MQVQPLNGLMYINFVGYNLIIRKTVRGIDASMALSNWRLGTASHVWLAEALQLSVCV
jgi:hypothetical protein